MIIKQVPPARISALLVGIEKYAAGAAWDVDGPASDARRFADWLHQGLGVPDDNILLFLSPLDKNQGVLGQAGPQVQQATRELIYRAITVQLRQREGDLLLLYWAGHGVITLDDTRRLFYSDATTENLLNMDFNSLLSSLRTDYWPAFPSQVCLVDACAKYVGPRDLPVSLPEETFPAGQPLQSREQFVLLGAKPGDLAEVKSKEKTGVFSREVLSLLQEPDDHPPDLAGLIQKLQKRFQALRSAGETSQTPTYLWYRDWKGEEGALGRPRAAVDGRLSATQKGPRARYLKNVKEDVENRLRVSIYNARFIDLGIETVQAAGLPWVYKDLDSLKQFDKLEGAFTHSHRRLLLLGAPGAGKTTTQLHIAQQLIAEADEDENAPVPLLVNLSQFQLAAPAPSVFSWWGRRRPEKEERDQRLEQWLVGVLKYRANVSAKVARQWMKEDRVAVLMDGFDEVDSERRAELVRLLNAFLSDHLETVVMVCSRTNEYLALPDSEETRLLLSGKVTLHPLTKEQIEAYLNAAQATGLREALTNDAGLYEMAQTPLTLSMMTLAYGGLAPSDIPVNLSLTERRHYLMEAYVARMLQRKERRDRNIPFDRHRQNDVPERQYMYRPDQVNRYLGWLAVRLCVRMQTAFSLERFNGFLTQRMEREPRQAIGWCVTSACAVLGFLGALLVGVTLMPRSLGGFLQVNLISVFVTVVGALVATAARKPRGRATELALFNLVVVYAIAGVGIAGSALAAIVAGGESAWEIGLIATCVVVAFMGAVSAITSAEKRSRLLWLIGLTAASFPASAASAHLFGHPEDTRRILAAFLVSAQGTWYVLPALHAWIRPEAVGLARMPFALFLIAIIVCCQLVAGQLFDPSEWYKPFAVIAAAASFLVHFHKKSLFTGLVLLSILGGVVGGVVGASLALALYCILLLLQPEVRLPWVNRLFNNLTEFLEERMQRHVISPILLRVIILTHGLPFRCQGFIGYATDSLLLKQSADDVEFMHRLLRDYFALHDLWPLLKDKDLEGRLEAIRVLGFLEETGWDLLTAFAGDRDLRIRAAAVSALGMMAAPQVVQHIEAALRDPEPTVRRAAVLSFRNLRREDFERLVRSMTRENAPVVAMALVEVLANRDEWMSGADDIVGQLLGNTGRSSELLRQVVVLLDRMDIAGIAQRLPPWAKESLPGFLIDDNPKLRGGALKLLGESLRQDRRLGERAPSATPSEYTKSGRQRVHVTQITSVLKNDTQSWVRAMAAQVLALLADAGAVDSLIQALTDRVPDVRGEAAEALGKLGDGRAVEPLMHLLTDRVARVRQRAAKALGQLGDGRAVEPLIRALTDQAMCDEVAEALRRLGDARAVAPLIQALTHRVEDVRRAAASALYHLDREQFERHWGRFIRGYTEENS